MSKKNLIEISLTKISLNLIIKVKNNKFHKWDQNESKSFIAKNENYFFTKGTKGKKEIKKCGLTNRRFS